MINEIGEDSGKIWQYLSQRPQAVLRDINKTLRQGDNMLFVAIAGLHGKARSYSTAKART